MTNDEFVKELKKINLNKKEFAALTELAYSTVANWSSSDNVPSWVKSWLENYIEKKRFDKIKTILKDSGVC